MMSIVLYSIIGTCMLCVGFFIGEQREKRKNDKKMAAIVADRLLHKSQEPNDFTKSGIQAQLNATQGQGNFMGQLGSSGQAGLLNSLFGGNPIVREANESNFPEIHK
jgi:hypothetical protein